MTAEEFDRRGFGFNESCIYKGVRYPIVSVDFEERLVGIKGYVQNEEDGEWTWVRCENVSDVRREES
jgi:hypothetical protein